MNWMIFVSCLLFILSMGCFAGAIAVYFLQRKKFAERTTTTGVVVDVKKNNSFSTSLEDVNNDFSSNTPMSYPEIEFKTISGETVRFTSNIGTNPPRYQTGQSVKVAYNIADPSQADIDSRMSRLLVPIILAIFGAVMIFISVIFAIVLLIGNIQ